MRFGIHVPKQRTLEATAVYAADIGCETMQIFSGNPMSWSTGRLDERDRDAFRDAIREAGIAPVLVHTPYLINIASPDRELKLRSREALAAALVRSDELGAGPVVVHGGNHKGSGPEAGISQARRTIEWALKQSPDAATLAVENGAGMGTSVGSLLEELGAIVEPFPRERVGVLLDTAHLWAMGYDLRTPEGVDRLADDVGRTSGLDRLVGFHINDSTKELGSRRDHHALWTEGRMGMRALRNIVRNERLNRLPAVFEIPGETAGFDRRRLAAMKRRDRRYGSRPPARELSGR